MFGIGLGIKNFHLMYRDYFHILHIVLVALLLLAPVSPFAHAETKRINSVKSLTHVLSKIEKEHDDKASFVTMKLQIYLEDVYISQGTTVYFKPSYLSTALRKMIAEGNTKKEMARKLVKMYQDGEFND